MMEEQKGMMSGIRFSSDEEFVEVVFARSSSEARQFVGMLQEHEIPAQLESGAAAARESGVAVLVPSDRLVEASECLSAFAQLEDEDVESDDDIDDLDDDYDDSDDDEDDFDDDDEDDDDECDDDDDGFEEEEEEEEP